MRGLPNEPKYVKDDHTYYCYLKYNDKEFIGKTTCLPEDQDMESEKIGYFIAESRAAIKYLKYVRSYEIKPGFLATKQLFDIINSSKKTNKKSHEYRMIKRQYYFYKNDLDIINKMIDEYKNQIIGYIMIKDKLHMTIREKRNAGKTN